MTEAAASNDDPLPVGQTLTPEELQGRFTLTEVRPAANPGHGFRLLVPKGWVADTIDGMDQRVNTMQLTPLAGWHAPKEGAPVVFHVQAVDLTRVITAAHFTVSYGLRQQLELMAMRELSSFLADARLRQRIEAWPPMLRSPGVKRASMV